MAKVMMTLKAASRPSLADIQSQLNLAPEDLDVDFGVVEVDPQQGLYTFMVDQHKASQLRGVPGISGPFSNPPIAPFGPPE